MRPDDTPDPMSGLDDLLAAERAAPAPDAAARARVSARVAATLAAGAGVTATAVTAATAEAATVSTVSATTAGAAAGATLGGKVFLGLAATVLAGGTFVAVAVRGAREPAPAPAPPETAARVVASSERPAPVERPVPPARPVVEPRVEAAPPPVEPLRPQPRRVPRAAVVQTPPPAPPEPAPPPPAVDAALIAERGLLAEARRALGAGDTAAALAALESHRRTHADGRLGEERDALEISTLSAAGRRAEAASRAAAFLARHPDSIFAASVKKYAAPPNP